jgi:hypothetical protein
MTIPSERAPRVVVTGAAGFSGWHTQVLLRALVGFEIVSIRRDDFAGENLVYWENDRRNLLTQGLHPRRIRAARERGGGLCGHVIVDLAIGHWALRQRHLLTPHLWRDTPVNLNDNALTFTATAQREEEGRGPFLRRQLGSGRGPQTGSSTPRRPGGVSGVWQHVDRNGRGCPYWQGHQVDDPGRDRSSAVALYVVDQQASQRARWSRGDSPPQRHAVQRSLSHMGVK